MKRMLMGDPSSSVSVLTMVVLRRFSAHSLWKGVGTMSVISSLDNRWTRIGLIQDSKTGVVSLPSSCARQFCHKKPSFVSTAVAVSILSCLVFAKRKPAEFFALTFGGSRALVGGKPDSCWVCATFSCTQIHSRHASDVDRFSIDARNST